MLSYPYLPAGSGGGGGQVEIVTWADGTDEQIKAMIDAADIGKIDLTDYWSIGDERAVSLSAMPNTLEYHPAQTVIFILMDTGENSNYEDENSKIVNFVVGLKNCLNEKGYIQATSSSSDARYRWSECSRRTWCNSIFRESIPAIFRGIFKRFKVFTGFQYNGTYIETTIDVFALFAPKEVLGSGGYTTEENALKQIRYYEVSANRIKYVSGLLSQWWGRSPASSSSPSYFVSFSTDGSPGGNTLSDQKLGLAPFGCI